MKRTLHPPARGDNDHLAAQLERLVSAIPGTLPHEGRQLAALVDAWAAPRKVQQLLSRHCPRHVVLVSGPIEDRLILVGREQLFHGMRVNGHPLAALRLPAGLQFATPQADLSLAQISATGLNQLQTPGVKLLALCHPEVFPVPRFPLGISDLARAVRCTYRGTVELYDMQLGLSETAAAAHATDPFADIVGISATFGQHDILQRLLERLARVRRPEQLIVAGGSLAALNVAALLEAFPWLLVATGPGEPTMADLVAHFHGELELSRVRYLRTAVMPRTGGARHLARRRVDHRQYDDFLPELDLLGATLDTGGVLQLESSRGCTHACSFCPRTHKGTWHGDDAQGLGQLLAEVEPIYAARPHITRKVFLVDEEFIGRDGATPAVERARRFAGLLSNRGFRWEANSRVDQVCDPKRDAGWHRKRARLWSDLRQNGLDRCLFGVESGVDSILTRFNKRTSAQQNVCALRTLTSLGVPVRCTYITFDPLMSLPELQASYVFLGRTDLLLKQQANTPPELIPQRVQHDAWAAEQSMGQPFYTHVSYMLVSMECLLGSPYLRAVEQAGLAGDLQPAMGRRAARYLDPAIGRMSDWAQRWVDRNFSLDYTLKGLEKLATGAEREHLRRLRFLLRSASYGLLGDFLHNYGALVDDRPLRELCEQRAARLATNLAGQIGAIAREVGSIRADRFSLVQGEFERWTRRTGWERIHG